MVYFVFVGSLQLSQPAQRLKALSTKSPISSFYSSAQFPAVFFRYPKNATLSQILYFNEHLRNAFLVVVLCCKYTAFSNIVK